MSSDYNSNFKVFEYENTEAAQKTAWEIAASQNYGEEKLSTEDKEIYFTKNLVGARNPEMIREGKTIRILEENLEDDEIAKYLE